MPETVWETRINEPASLPAPSPPEVTTDAALGGGRKRSGVMMVLCLAEPAGQWITIISSCSVLFVELMYLEV